MCEPGDGPGVTAGAAKEATKDAKKATHSTGPLAAGGQGPPTHQARGSLENCPNGGSVDGGRAPDAEVMAMTKAKVALKGAEDSPAHVQGCGARGRHRSHLRCPNG
jgi:hypothetical protein